MTAIDNSGFLNVCHNCGGAGFTPGISYAFVAATKKLTVTNTSTFPAGDSLNVVNITVTDRFGNSKTAQITTAPVVVDLVVPFDVSLGFNIQATVVSNKRLLADLSAYDVASTIGAASGVLGNADIETDEADE
jgi:hypothetical protein